jgi:hypothetical protein
MKSTKNIKPTYTTFSAPYKCEKAEESVPTLAYGGTNKHHVD